MTDVIENRPFDELEIGDVARLERVLAAEDIELFAFLSGDVNPAHLDPAYAEGTPFKHVIAHGMWGGALISAVLGAELPGPGTIYVRQELKFVRPVYLGARVAVQVTVREKRPDTKRVLLDCLCTADGKAAIVGEAEVIAPDRKISRPRTALHPVFVHERGSRLAALQERARACGPLAVAVLAAAPNAVAAAEKAGLARPIPAATASEAAALIEQGAAKAVWTDIARLPAGAERLANQGRLASHVTLLDAPTYHKTLFITDAAFNIAPRAAEKEAIVANAIAAARALGVARPKVAALASAVALRHGLPSATDAATLAQPGRWPGALVAGPLPLEAAIGGARSVETVNGDADILLAPDIETADLMVKQLDYLGGAVAAGLALGLKAPVIACDSADPQSWLAACAAAALLLA